MLYYAHHVGLPVLGNPGGTYEAQQGPLAYGVDGATVRIVQAFGFSLSTAFTAVRFIGLLELLVAVAATATLLRGVAPSSRIAVAAVAFLALSPMLLAMASSVQNDTLALALGITTLSLAHDRLTARSSVKTAAGLGVFTGLAVLAKLTALAILPAIVVWLARNHGRASARVSGWFLGGFAASCGWWFVRNLSLYGDVTGAKAVARTGVSFPPYHFHSLGSVGHILQEVVTYLWVPTEYFRNLLTAGFLVKAVIVALAIGFFVGGFRRTGRIPGLVAACGLVSVLGWLGIFLFYEGTPPRLAYMALPLWAAITAGALCRLRAPLFAIALSAGVLISLNVWTLVSVHGVHSPSSVSVAFRTTGDGHPTQLGSLISPQSANLAAANYVAPRGYASGRAEYLPRSSSACRLRVQA